MTKETFGCVVGGAVTTNVAAAAAVAVMMKHQQSIKMMKKLAFSMCSLVMFIFENPVSCCVLILVAAALSKKWHHSVEPQNTLPYSFNISYDMDGSKVKECWMRSILFFDDRSVYLLFDDDLCTSG